MATPEEAITTALSGTWDTSKILAWTNNETTGQLQIVYEGAQPVNSENITVVVLNVHDAE